MKHSIQFSYLHTTNTAETKGRSHHERPKQAGYLISPVQPIHEGKLVVLLPLKPVSAETGLEADTHHMTQNANATCKNNSDTTRQDLCRDAQIQTKVDSAVTVDDCGWIARACRRRQESRTHVVGHGGQGYRG